MHFCVSEPKNLCCYQLISLLIAQNNFHSDNVYISSHTTISITAKAWKAIVGVGDDQTEMFCRKHGGLAATFGDLKQRVMR